MNERQIQSYELRTKGAEYAYIFLFPLIKFESPLRNWKGYKSNEGVAIAAERREKRRAFLRGGGK